MQLGHAILDPHHANTATVSAASADPLQAGSKGPRVDEEDPRAADVQ
jgi:hypothetical protein